MRLKSNENAGKSPPWEQRSDYPKLKIDVRGTGARFFINFAEELPHRASHRWTQVRCQQVGNVLRRTPALCKYVTLEPAIEPISASLGCRGQLLPSIIPPWSCVPHCELQRKLFCLSVFVRLLLSPSLIFQHVCSGIRTGWHIHGAKQVFIINKNYSCTHIVFTADCHQSSPRGRRFPTKQEWKMSSCGVRHCCAPTDTGGYS